MRTAARQTRENRTITVDFQNEATYGQLLGDGKAFVECVLAFLLALGLQLKHKATCRGGGCLTRHSHYARIRLGGLTIWRVQCTTCRAVFTVLPHFILRYRQMRPEVARDALLATHGGLSLALCAVISHIAPMALYHLVCAFGHHSLVTPMFKGVWSTAVNFAPLPSPDTRPGQYPPHDKRSDDSPGRHGLGGWAGLDHRAGHFRPLRIMA